MSPPSSRAPGAAVHARGPLRPAGRRRLRFPCGHVDAEAGVVGRLRTRRRALWVPCGRCNVVALVVARIDGT